MTNSCRWRVLPFDEYAVHTVTFLKGAILAGVAMLALGPLAEPQFVRFRLADGVQVVGNMTSWDAEGFDGSFGRRLWTEITIRDVWRLYVQVMDQSEAEGCPGRRAAFARRLPNETVRKSRLSMEDRHPVNSRRYRRVRGFCQSDGHRRRR